MLKTMQQLSEEARKDIPEVQTPDVRKDVDNGGGKLPYILVDVREPQEHEKGIIPGATPIARGVLEMQITKVTQDENAPIVCYCGGGTRSLFAAQQLKRMGFTNVKSMAGGFGAWAKAGNPVGMPK
jgi:adenylyltransferase/sulfurtransferase